MLRKYHKPAEYVLLSYLIYEETEAQRDEVTCSGHTAIEQQSWDFNPFGVALESLLLNQEPSAY